MSLVKMRRRWIGRYIMSIALVFCATVRAAQYSAIDLYTLNPPAGVTIAGLGVYQPSGAGTVVGYGEDTNHLFHGLMWGNNGQPTDLIPTNLSGFSTSIVRGISGNQQVGEGGGTATGFTPNKPIVHALLWNGTANSAVDLQPTNLSGFTQSQAYGTDATHQVAFALDTNNLTHAMVWNGSAASAVDLNPTQFTGYYESVAYGVDGTQQVGVMAGDQSNVQTPHHAMLWNGTAASAVDLNPTNPLLPTFDAGSDALGIGGGQEVGWGSYYSAGKVPVHALLWTGTAASAVDLNPAGSTNSEALSTNGSQQVGYEAVTIPNDTSPLPYAMLWSGTADSAINLQNLLPSNFALSTAYYIDSIGNVYGVAEDTSGNYHAVEWVTSAPEPSSSFLLACGILAIICSRRACNRQTVTD